MLMVFGKHRCLLGDVYDYKQVQQHDLAGHFVERRDRPAFDYRVCVTTRGVELNCRPGLVVRSFMGAESLLAGPDHGEVQLRYGRLRLGYC